MYKILKDEYVKNRGGSSRILDITCYYCNTHVTYYQKDGPGILKRMYIDRFIDYHPTGKSFACPANNHELGRKMHYKKENRSAYRLFVGAVNKKIISIDKVTGYDAR